jgi:hypothetical protein
MKEDSVRGVDANGALERPCHETTVAQTGDLPKHDPGHVPQPPVR